MFWRKLIKPSFLACIVALAIVFANVPIFAASTNTNSDEQLIVGSSASFYYDADENSISYEAPRISQEVQSDNDFEVLSFGESRAELFLSRNNEGQMPLADYESELFVLGGGLSNCENGVFTWYFNLDCPSSLIVKPDVTLLIQLQIDYTDGLGTYYDVGPTYKQDFNSNLDYAYNYEFDSKARTGYYRFLWLVTFEGDADTEYNVSPTILTNRTGKGWGLEFTDGLGKTLPTPRADYVKGAIYARDPNCAKKYYQTYEELNGVVLDSTLYDVHHIQPLSYGGDNSYSNLIHLPKELHQKVTNWFNGY